MLYDTFYKNRFISNNQPGERFVYYCVYNPTPQPGEKIAFSFLMHEINVLTNWTILVILN